MEPIGRGQVISRLTPLPVCSIIRAPASTGKRTTAEYLTTKSGILSIDRRLVPAPYWSQEQDRLIEPELSVEMIRDLIPWIGTAPRSPAGKVVILRLDHERTDGSSWRASSRCVTSLLKTLEEPPPYVRFILLASQPVAPVLLSRSVTVSAGLLSTSDVTEILHRISDLDLTGAALAASLGGGRVAPSLLASEFMVGAREAVLGVLSDLAASDMDAAQARAKEWSSVSTELLVRAAHERISGRFRIFDSKELASLSNKKALSILSVIRRTFGARPRFVLNAVVSTS